MKKGIIIALCGIAIAFAGCKKPIDYTGNYVGDYLGQFNLTITSMNNTPQSNLSIPFQNIGMEIAKGSEFNSLTATVKVENESHQTQAIATEDKVDFGTIHLDIDKPDQLYKFNLDLEMDGQKTQGDTLTIIGSFTGNGKASFPTPQGMQEQTFNEVSGTINGILVKQ